MSLAAAAGVAFFVGLALLAVGIVNPVRRRRVAQPQRRGLRDMLPAVKDREGQNLRLAGIAPEAYAIQRLAGLVGGLVAGIAISVLSGRGALGGVIVTALVTALGWFLPMLGVRDTAKKARLELDDVVRVWVVLVAQQVSAGVDPSVAMLAAARIGKRPAWRLLHRFLLTAQQERRPAWEGLVDIVERYGIFSLSPIVSALALAAGRGTRVSDAVLTAAESLWQDTTAREREKAARRAQVVVVPATGVALALAGILVYPPFTALTGSGGGGLG
ncbi:MAG: hypothetical protein F4121_00415 [Acidimicrobiia bacterium]|nr:hypothetical protein [Acidimicrobiia bacterium]MYC45373.1 hypothetical protein [Acidimicrobiia bacterium]MYI18588.1 hypothetical protein [Acidimicrobiia bacterium]